MTNRLIKHFFSLCGSQVINLLGGLLLVPVFLAHWPVVIYGEWLALSSLANYLATLDFGMNSAAGNSMLAAHINNEEERYTRYLHSATVFYTIVGILGTLVCAGLSLFAPIGHWLGVRAISGHTAALTWFLLSLQPLWAMLVGLIVNVYRTHGDPARTVWFNNARSIVIFAGTGAAVMLGCSLPITATIPIVVIAVSASIAIADIRLRYPTVQFGIRGATLQEIRALIKPSLGFAAISVAIAITMQGTVLVVSTFLGGAAVAVFVSTRTLCNAAMQVVNIVKNAAWPDLTILYAKGDLTRLRAMNQLLVCVATTLSIAAAVTLWFDGPSIFRIWTHHRLTPSVNFLRMMLLYLVMQAVWMVSTAVPVAANRHEVVARCWLASSILGVVLACVLVRRFGLPGVPLGLLLSEAVVCNHFVVRDSCRLLKEPYARFAARTWLIGIAISILVCCVTALADSWFHGPILVKWSAAACTALASSFALSWAFWLNPTTRLALNTRGRAFVRGLLASH